MKGIISLSFLMAIILFPELALAADPPGTESMAGALLSFMTQGTVAISIGAIVLAIIGYRVMAGRATWEDAVKFVVGSILVYGATALVLWIIGLVQKG